MEHLQIAYYLSVILVGIAVLAMAGFWAFKTREAYLRNFIMVYASFTLVLIIAVLKGYLSLNVESYSARVWYSISGIYEVFSIAVLIAVSQFFLELYLIPFRRMIIFLCLFIAFVCVGLIYSPFGATLDINRSTIHFGVGYKIALIGYLSLFSFALMIGYGFLRRIWNTDKRNFVLGFLLFATIGYGETLSGFSQNMRVSTAVLERNFNFLFSSIPYTLYGFFLISYFLRYHPPVALGFDRPSETFLSKYGITDRECEIIVKIIQGKSNADVASELFISLATVKTHLHNIYRKAGVNSRYDLLARVRAD